MHVMFLQLTQREYELSKREEAVQSAEASAARVAAQEAALKAREEALAAREVVLARAKSSLVAAGEEAENIRRSHRQAAVQLDDKARGLQEEQRALAASKRAATLELNVGGCMPVFKLAPLA